MMDFLSNIRPLEVLVLGHFAVAIVMSVASWFRRGRKARSHSKAELASQMPVGIDHASLLPTENFGYQATGGRLSRSLLD